jgi:hypothetical protein
LKRKVGAGTVHITSIMRQTPHNSGMIVVNRQLPQNPDFECNRDVSPTNGD